MIDVLLEKRLSPDDELYVYSHMVIAKCQSTLKKFMGNLRHKLAYDRNGYDILMAVVTATFDGKIKMLTDLDNIGEPDMASFRFECRGLIFSIIITNEVVS